jgi:hypothetical protein
MALEYPNAVYRGGHEAVLLFGVEQGMLAPDAQTIGAAPAMQLVGFSTPPTVTANANPQPVYAGGSADPLAMIGGRKDVTASGQVMLGSGPGVKKFLQSALRGADAPVGSFPLAQRKGCQPVSAVGFGAFDQCDSASGFLSYLRYFMMTSLSISAREQGAVMVDWAGLALLAGDAQAPLAANAVTGDLLRAAQGNVFAMQHMQLVIIPANGGTTYDYQDITNSITFAQPGNVTPKGIRSLNSVAGDPTNPLYRSARQLVPGTRPATTVTMDISDRLAASLTPGEGLAGVIEAEFSDGVNSIIVGTQTAFYQTSSQNGGSTEGQMGFGTSFLCSGLYIV